VWARGRPDDVQSKDALFGLDQEAGLPTLWTRMMLARVMLPFGRWVLRIRTLTGCLYDFFLYSEPCRVSYSPAL